MTKYIYSPTPPPLPFGVRGVATPPPSPISSKATFPCPPLTPPLRGRATWRGKQLGGVRGRGGVRVIGWQLGG